MLVNVYRICRQEYDARRHVWTAATLIRGCRCQNLMGFRIVGVDVVNFLL